MGGARGSSQVLIILNATPLIYIAKVGLAKKITLLPYRICTTDAVYDEVVVKGSASGAHEVAELRELFAMGKLHRINPKEHGIRNLEGSGIQHGEATIIALALERKAKAVIDDKRARHVARVLGADLIGTPHVIAYLVAHGIVSRQEAMSKVDEMINEGWRCSAKHYSQIREMLEHTSVTTTG